jgi:hypothetical protein
MGTIQHFLLRGGNLFRPSAGCFDTATHTWQSLDRFLHDQITIYADLLESSVTNQNP